MKKMMFALTVCLAAGVFFVVPTSKAQSDVMRTHFINVGRGDATLLEFPCGAVLVDAGGNRRALTSYLDRFFARRSDLNNTLSLVVLTHGHPDHVANIGTVMQRYAVGTVVENGRTQTRLSKKLNQIYAAHPATQIKIAQTGNIPRGGRFDPAIDQLNCAQTDPDIRVLSGSLPSNRRGWTSKELSKENNHSVTLLVQWGRARILLTGDLHVAGLEDLLKTHGSVVKNVNLYHISHHGFKNATSRKTLKQINPQIAVLSRPQDRAWHRGTKRIFDTFTRSKRPTVTIPIWKYQDAQTTGPKWRQDTSSYDHDTDNRPRMVTDEPLSAGVYWTGRDGHVIVDVHTNGSLAVRLQP